jgi:hypothetical protein
MNRDTDTGISNPSAMFSQTDLTNLNVFVDTTVNDVPEDKANNYKEYYIEKQEIENQQVVTNVLGSGQNNVGQVIGDNNIQRNVATDSQYSLVSQKLNSKQKLLAEQIGNVQFNNGPVDHTPLFKTVLRKRKIYLDSQFRDKYVYPDAADMVLTWGRTFTNVISMTMISSEFSNVSQVISTTNNKLYWINLEDNDLSSPYPIYHIAIPPGSYTFSTLQSTLVSYTNAVRRHNGSSYQNGTLPFFHFFVMNISDDTDFVQFVSIIAKPTPANPITTTAGSSVAFFSFPNHGFADGDTVYITGVLGILGGFQSSVFNSNFKITVSSVNQFSFQINNIFSSMVAVHSLKLVNKLLFNSCLEIIPTRSLIFSGYV